MCRSPRAPRSTCARPAAALLVALLAATAPARAAVYVVAESGGDFTSIQAALNVAVAGDTVSVMDKPTPYFEKLVFPASGNAVDGHITLEAAAGESPILDGTGVPGDDMIRLENRSWIKIVGFEIRNLIGVNDGSGIRVLGAGDHIELRDNRIHAIGDENAMGITVYGTAPTPISDLVIDGNEIYDCQAAPSEALVLNGNVTDFAITGNHVHDIDNIGIDCIGGETSIQPDQTKVCRNGVIRGNLVERARSVYGGGFAAGIYVDGGRDVVIEHNRVTECDIGMEIGAENQGLVTRGVIVRNNVIHRNDKSGLGFGGYASSVGRVRECRFLNNTLFENDTLGAGFGTLWIQYGDANEVKNNVFVGMPGERLLVSEYGDEGNVLNYNLWFSSDPSHPALFSWNGASFSSLMAYVGASSRDGQSTFSNPMLVAPASGDFHLGPGGFAENGGDPAFVPAPGETDLDGGPRVNGPRVDVGADERTSCGDGTPEAPEECDDGGLVDGDGCDSNCTVTGCGNGIVTAGEQCDPGDALGAVDCCDAACQLEADGDACSDGNPCTPTDTCAAGVCVGAETPVPCTTAAGGSLQLKDRTPGTPEKSDQLGWQWSKGGLVLPGQVGDPVVGGTAYDLCVYDEVAGVGQLRLRARIPAGGFCAGKPCWRTKPNGSVSYADKTGTPDGVTSLAITPGAAGRSSAKLKAKGPQLPMPSLPFAQSPSVIAQLRSSAGLCAEVALPGPAARNDGNQFKDKQ